MTYRRTTPLDLVAATLHEEGELRARARELGVVRRQGKLDVYALLVCFILGVSARGTAAMAQCGHLLAELTGTRFARSSIWARFSPAFSKLVQSVLDEQILRARRAPRELPRPLRQFRDVVSVDATVVKVDDQLAPIWKGTRTHTARAALKVHTQVRALTGELLKYTITPDAHGDSRALKVSHDLRGRLLLLDKAYSSPSLWRRIESVGGYFLTRLPKDRDPVLVEVLRRCRGRAKKLEGRSLREALAGLQRQVVDVTGTFRCRVRKYGTPTNRWTEETFRLVAIRDRRGHYEVFATHASPEMLDAELVPRTYRLRWEVETFYKTAKSGCGLHELPSRQKHVVEAFVYASLLRATMCMQALGALREEVADVLGLRINPGQWVRWWRREVYRLLEDLLADRHRLSLLDLVLLLHDPNVGRCPNRAWFRDQL